MSQKTIDYMLYYLTSTSQSFLKTFSAYRFQSGQNLQITSILERKRHAQKSGSWGRAWSKKPETNLNALFHICFNPRSDTVLPISCCFLEKQFRLKYIWERTYDLKKQFRKVQRVVFFSHSTEDFCLKTKGQ